MNIELENIRIMLKMMTDQRDQWRDYALLLNEDLTLITREMIKNKELYKYIHNVLTEGKKK